MYGKLCVFERWVVYVIVFVVFGNYNHHLNFNLLQVAKERVQIDSYKYLQSKR